VESLKQHFKDSMLAGLLPEDLKDEDRDPKVVVRIETMAEQLAEGIIEFLIAQDFKLIKGKLVVDLETFTTTKGQTTQVKQQTLLGPYSPILTFLEKIASLGSVLPPLKPLQKSVDQVNKSIKTATKLAAVDGATSDPFDLSKKQGGLKSKGYVHVGTGEVDDEGLGQETVIKLPEDDIRKE
tara:strand:- start:2411 stop:2956 length:546 start_codon:yes stop_codon:yes gene_type:complete